MPFAALDLPWSELFAATRVALAVNDPYTERFLYVSPAYARLHGWDDPRALIGQPIRVVYAPDAWRELEATIARVHAERAVSFETTHVRRDGTPFPVRVDAREVVDAGGRPLYRVVTVEDLTERREHERRLRESETRYRALADSTPALLWQTDAAGRCTFVNAAWLALTGRSEAAELGVGWRDALHPDDAARVAAEYDAAAAQRRPLRLEYRLRAADGSWRWLLSVGAPRLAPDGTLAGYVGSCVDLTARRGDEAERERLLQAESAARAAAERAARQAFTLQVLTAALSAALTQERIARVVLDEALPAFGAAGGWLGVREPGDGVHVPADREMLTVIGTRGLDATLTAPLVRTALDGPTLTAEVARTGEPRFLVVGSAERWAARYPASAAFVAGHHFGALCVVPLVVGERTVGALSMAFADAREPAPDERAQMLAFAAQCAQALERARLRAAENAARDEVAATHARHAESARFLADAGTVLASSLDYVTTLTSVARLAVPFLADYCVVDVLDPETGAVARVATAHADPAQEAALAELRRYPPRPDSGGLVARVLASGRSEVVADAAPARIHADAAAVDPLAEAVLRLAPTSYMCVPLVARGAVLGALLLATTTRSHRRFDDAARRDAEELARRAALAVDNARLYRAAERARADADEARRRAEEANRAKSEFLAVMSHELRTPLNAIQGHVQLLEMELHGPVSDAQRDALRRVDRAQRHLLRLINDVLNFAKLDAGRVDFDLRPTLVRDVVAEIAPLIEPQLAEQGVAFAVRLPEHGGGPPVPVLADRDKLGQVLLNLLANAARFTPAGGQVTIELCPEPATVALHVHDTGIGIPPERLEAIFEPFVQVDNSLTRARGGTGLGLAISRELVRGMGGELVAASTPGAGSTFTVRLPHGDRAHGERTRDERARDDR